MTSSHDLISFCDVAIIGGGLSGLAAFHLIDRQGLDVRLFEAKERLGGRIDSVRDQRSGKPVADLGPTWVWPPYQPTVAHWMEKLGIKSAPQYETGPAVLDYGIDRPTEHRQIPGQHGMVRLVGGPQAFIDELSALVPAERISLNTSIDKIVPTPEGFQLSSGGNSTRSITARSLVFAISPRIAEAQFGLQLFDQKTSATLRQTPTWMAAQAKTVITYAKPFWRKAGLSGRVASASGPLMEVHDHCSADGKTAALFGFVGWPPQQRKDTDLNKAIAEQLIRCFGTKAGAFLRIETRDWSQESTICSEIDFNGPAAHPTAMPAEIRMGSMNNRLFFAGAETAVHSPGLIDGALEAAERVAAQVATTLLE